MRCCRNYHFPCRYRDGISLCRGMHANQIFYQFVQRTITINPKKIRLSNRRLKRKHIKNDIWDNVIDFDMSTNDFNPIIKHCSWFYCRQDWGGRRLVVKLLVLVYVRRFSRLFELIDKFCLVSFQKIRERDSAENRLSEIFAHQMPASFQLWMDR